MKNNYYKGAFWLCFIILSTLLCVGGTYTVRKGGLSWLKAQVSGLAAKSKESVYDQTQRSIQDSYPPIESVDTVVIGDSNVSQIQFSELLPELKIRNRGISGETTEEVLSRMEHVITGKPEHIILCAGLNDAQRKYPWERTQKAIAGIADRVKAGSPKTKLWALEAVAPNPDCYDMFIRPSYPGIHMPTPEEASRINQELVRAGFTLISLGLADGSGHLKKEYTIDGLHWSKKALENMKQEIGSRLSVRLASQ